MNANRLKTEVLIVGGGATGTGLVRDLSMRGIRCILVEQGDINSGASGGNHGLLHSGARYVCSDMEAAIECRVENQLIRKLAPQCVEETGGLFIAVKGDDERYIADFPHLCERSGIPYRKLSCREVLEKEPNISPDIIAAYEVEDAAVDPFRLSLENAAHAASLGALILTGVGVTGFNKRNGRIESVSVLNQGTGEASVIEADYVVNAAGAWADGIAAMAGAKINMVYSKGTLLVTGSRISRRVVNRLRKAGSADIIVPGGTVSIVGTTSLRVDNLDDIRPTVEEVDFIVDEGAIMAPILEITRYIRAYSGVRPLVSASGGADDRDVSRGFALIDHEEEGIGNLITITGGKLTTFRHMAEKTADHVCRRMGNSQPCKTAEVPLPESESCSWTEPGHAPAMWLKGEHKSGDTLLCECEMVSGSVIDSIVSSVRKESDSPLLKAVGLRSRVGKGPCQGSLCGLRICSYMYDKGYLDLDSGVRELYDFYNERWKGQYSLSWGDNMARAELHEALQCGMFGMELKV